MIQSILVCRVYPMSTCAYLVKVLREVLAITFAEREGKHG